MKETCIWLHSLWQRRDHQPSLVKFFLPGKLKISHLGVMCLCVSSNLEALKFFNLRNLYHILFRNTLILSALPCSVGLRWPSPKRFPRPCRNVPTQHFDIITSYDMLSLTITDDNWIIALIPLHASCNAMILDNDIATCMYVWMMEGLRGLTLKNILEVNLVCSLFVWV